jgi:hypothetical protein
MHIIFDDAVSTLPDKFTILELDTFRVGDKTQTAWCVVENIPLADFPTVDAYKKVHSDLMQAYRDKNWEYCESAIKGLTGRWNGELDSFYSTLGQRIESLRQQVLDNTWDGIIEK